jgi:hypothetical protein
VLLKPDTLRISTEEKYQRPIGLIKLSGKLKKTASARNRVKRLISKTKTRYGIKRKRIRRLTRKEEDRDI